MHTAIHFLNNNKIQAIEIYRQINELCGEILINEALGRNGALVHYVKWRQNKYTKWQFSSQPSLITDKLEGKVDNKIQEGRC